MGENIIVTVGFDFSWLLDNHLFAVTSASNFSTHPVSANKPFVRASSTTDILQSC